MESIGCFGLIYELKNGLLLYILFINFIYYVVLKTRVVRRSSILTWFKWKAGTASNAYFTGIKIMLLVFLRHTKMDFVF